MHRPPIGGRFFLHSTFFSGQGAITSQSGLHLSKHDAATEVDTAVDLKNIDAFIKNEDADMNGLREELLQVKRDVFRLKSDIARLRQELETEKAENRRLEGLARLNQDTMLPLQREFMKDLGRLIEKRHEQFVTDGSEPVKPFAVAHIKLDETFIQISSEQVKKILAFKTVTLLSDIEMLRDNLYQGDRLEDFLVILPNVRNIEQAEVLFTDFIIPTISTPHIQSEGESIHFSCHVGMCVFPFHGDNYADLSENLEIATTTALRFKTRVAMFVQALADEHHHRMQVRRELRNARNSGFAGFELRFQPFVNGKGNVIGCETLVRWNHPHLGFLSPDLFISLAEQYGEMDMLGRWILYRACLEFRQWTKAGYDLEYVSVNLSPVQFGRPGLVDSIIGMLDSLGLKGSQLKLEITEGVIMKDPSESIEILHQFRSRGIRIAIDDFGSGYSSLNYLMKLPINTLKIDKSFVDDLTEKESNLLVVRSIIELARNLGLEILAEGVETKEQKDLLFHEGVHYIQGYYYAAPITGEEFAKILESNDYSTR